MSDEELPPAIPAATVVLLRDTDRGVETLMLHRNSTIAFGGMWVFPGGRIDPDDARSGDDPIDTARRAAAREALEEADVAVATADLVVLSHWEPPRVIPKRFATWFFVARAPAGPAGDVTIDGGEIHDHEWLAPEEVMARRDRGEVELAPPTWVTLHDLAAHPTVADALAWADRQDPVPSYVTHWKQDGDAAVAMWVGDAGYESSDPTIDGGRHRLWMRPDGWSLERR